MMKYPIDKNIARSALVRRSPDADKTTVGSLLSVCGSYGMAGAAIMSSKAALRGGIGLLKLAVPESIYPILAVALPEAVFYPVKGDRMCEFDFNSKSEYCGAALIGCGLSVNSDTRALVSAIVKSSGIPLVLDADALNIIAEQPCLLKEARCPIVLTPHIREFARLSGLSVDEINSDRAEAARSFAREYNVTVVLKGHITYVASPDGELRYNDSVGNAGMATGGSGDVLAGVIASLISQGAKPYNAACAGVYIHGLAGDIAKEKFGEISMLPTDIIDCLSESFKKIGI